MVKQPREREEKTIMSIGVFRLVFPLEHDPLSNRDLLRIQYTII